MHEGAIYERTPAHRERRSDRSGEPSGGGVARLIKSHHDEYLAAYGIDLKLTRACALAWEQAEAAGIEREAFTSDWHDVVTDPAVDIVVELIGGTTVARTFVMAAIESGASVVTANKALLAKYGPEI